MRRRLILVEATAMLALASLLIALLPFRRVAALAAAGRPGPVAPAPVAARLGHAVARCAERLPWRAVCFQQGLAAQFMLRRRGYAATLFYGAGRDEAGGLAAHVWVRSGPIDVIGCERLDRFGVLGIFPAP